MNFSLPVQYPDDAMNKRNPRASVGATRQSLGYAPTGRRLCCLIAAARQSSIAPAASQSSLRSAVPRCHDHRTKNKPQAVYDLGLFEV